MSAFQPLRCFRRNAKGAAAVEFALVVPLFLALVLVIFETGWMMTKVMMLDSAVDKTVRDLRIGREAGFTHDQIRDEICEHALIMPRCQESLLVELVPVNTVDDFPTTEAVCVDRDAEEQPPPSFAVGARAQMVFLRACIITDPITPLLGEGFSLPRDENGDFAIVTTSAFLNEPA